MIDERVGVVVIGRNEGMRLVRCLRSVVASGTTVVYVDSGSSDESVARAQAFGVTTVDLDLSRPFTAARARNTGYRQLLATAPGIEYVLFVDGDCEVRPGFAGSAARFLDGHHEVAAVCGRLRERFPERSIYNRLCNMEWDAPSGEVKSCGGNVLIRAAAFTRSGGFREDLIAGEEPELCVRLRAANWRIWRLCEEMALHDASMTRFGQWWKRAQRGGYAFAQGAHIHGAPPERHKVHEARRSVLWGIGLPMCIFLLASMDARALWLAFAYPLQVARLAMRYEGPAAWPRAFFMVLARFAEATGVLRFHWNRLLHRKIALIEYK